MWCPGCRADVAAELSTDLRRLACTQCQTELASLPSSRSLSDSGHSTTDAEQLLARWTAEETLGPWPDEMLRVTRLARRPESATAGPKDRGTEVAPVPTSPMTETVEETAPPARELQRRSKSSKSPAAVTNWTSLVAQATSYLGVLVLTAGGSAVIRGHYAMDAGLAMTGWTLATVGQMVLLCGLITTMSCHAEQMRQQLLSRMSRLERRLRKKAPHGVTPTAPPRSTRSAA